MIYRGNIIEVKSDSLVVMLDDCTFERVKKFKGLEEGMEIYFEKRDIIKKSNLNLKNIALVAASIFLLVVTTFYGVDVWDTNYRAIALISVDINPSIEIKINKNNNVINAIPLNEDAKKLPLNSLKNQPLDHALEELVNMARVEGYIKKAEENYILVTSVELLEGAQEEKILTDLIAEGKEKIERSSIEVGEQVEVIAIQSNKETLEEAKKENISVGKLKQLEKEAKQLEEKIKEIKKSNYKHNNNKNQNEVIKSEKDKVKEEIKQEKDVLKDVTKQEKDKVKEEIKRNKDREKQKDKDKEKEEKTKDKKEESKKKKENKEQKYKNNKDKSNNT